MNKKFLSYVLVAALAVSSLTACGTQKEGTLEQSSTGTEATVQSSDASNSSNEQYDPYGRYDKAVTITVARSFDPAEKLPEGDTPENNQYTRYIKENLNVDVKAAWAVANTNYEQKMNLCIASNDLPDAMVVGSYQFKTMAGAGQLEDLTDVIKNYASPIVKNAMDKTDGWAEKAISYDKKYMAIPSVNVSDDGYQLTWIRKDWLDKLGLEVPKTLDDLENVAKAFVERDPDGNGKADTIGISGPQNGGALYANFLAPASDLYGFDPVFSALHAYPGYWLEGSDGEAVYGSILPETKIALTKLRDWYSKGLIDKQMSIRKDSTELVVSGKTGIFFNSWWVGYWPLPDAIKNDPKANWQAYTTPLDDKGQWNTHMSMPVNSYVVVRKGYEHPELAMKIVNLNNRDEGKFDKSKGLTNNQVLRLPISQPDELLVTAKAYKEIFAGTKKPSDFVGGEYDLYSQLVADCENITKVKLQPYDNMDIQYWDPSADMSVWSRAYSILVGDSVIYDTPSNKVYSLLYSQTKSMQSKWANLKKMEDETFLKIIMGAAPVEAFDKFVQDWKTQGGDQITAEVDEASKH